jgi:hypothetical protein
VGAHTVCHSDSMSNSPNCIACPPPSPMPHEQLDHPSVVKLFDVFDDSTNLHLVMVRARHPTTPPCTLSVTYLENRVQDIPRFAHNHTPTHTGVLQWWRAS